MIPQTNCLSIKLNQNNEDVDKHKVWTTWYLKKESNHNTLKFPIAQAMPKAPRKLSTQSSTLFRTTMPIEWCEHNLRFWLPHIDLSFHDPLEHVINSIDVPK
jgi:hypothetical protein